ncbi:MAG: HEAT repeat domain-containing protein [Tissierellales bacterium]|nr:HEAT repeat domain-containing protein [Tissierellales bacterium]
MFGGPVLPVARAPEKIVRAYTKYKINKILIPTLKGKIMLKLPSFSKKSKKEESNKKESNKKELVVDERLGHKFNDKNICDLCGCSKSAIAGFGWKCTKGKKTRTRYNSPSQYSSNRTSNQTKPSGRPAPVKQNIQPSLSYTKLLSNNELLNQTKTAVRNYIYSGNIKEFANIVGQLEQGGWEINKIILYFIPSSFNDRDGQVCFNFLSNCIKNSSNKFVKILAIRTIGKFLIPYDVDETLVKPLHIAINDVDRDIRLAAVEEFSKNINWSGDYKSHAILTPLIELAKKETDGKIQNLAVDKIRRHHIAF